MPTFETKPTNREGHGPPSRELGTIGDKYTDLDNGERWAKRKTGWTNRGEVVIHPTFREKGLWARAAAGRDLERWAIKHLNAAAKNGNRRVDFLERKRNRKPLDPSIEAEVITIQPTKRGIISALNKYAGHPNNG